MIAPPAAIEQFVEGGKVESGGVNVGRVGLGAAVRPGAPAPDLSSADALKKSVLDAESIVFNRASTGIYFENLLKKMGIYEQVEAKTTRYADGASVMEHVLKGKGREIGFGAITEILLYKDKGLRLVGPLPADVQNYTSYIASPMTGGANAAAARGVREVPRHARGQEALRRRRDRVDAPRRGERSASRVRRRAHRSLELQNVEPRVAVREVDQPALVHVDVVRLRRGLAGGGLGDEPADFLRRRRVGDVDDAQARPRTTRSTRACRRLSCAPGTGARRSVPGVARLHGESSSLTSKIASGWMFAGSVMSNVHSAARAAGRGASPSPRRCARGLPRRSRPRSACRRSCFGSAMKVCEGSGNGGW